MKCSARKRKNVITELLPRYHHVHRHIDVAADAKLVADTCPPPERIIQRIGRVTIKILPKARTGVYPVLLFYIQIVLHFDTDRVNIVFAKLQVPAAELVGKWQAAKMMLERHSHAACQARCQTDAE